MGFFSNTASKNRLHTSVSSHRKGKAALEPDSSSTDGCRFACKRAAFYVTILVILIAAAVCLIPLVKTSSGTAKPSYASTSVYIIQSKYENGAGVSATLKLLRSVYPNLGPEFDELTLTAERQTRHRLHVLIAPSTQARWQVPQSVLPRPPASPRSADSAALPLLDVLPANGSAFSLTVRRDVEDAGNTSSEEPLAPGAVPPARPTSMNPTPPPPPPPALFHASGLTFKDQFLSIATTLPEDACLYGLGQGAAVLTRHVPRGSKGCGGLQVLRDGRTSTLSHGAHPFVLDVRPDGTAHGILLLSSNAMDVVLEARRLTFRLIGGVLDLYLFLGPTPEDVIRQYHEVVGRPALPPRWALGVQQARLGCRHVDDLKRIVKGYHNTLLPLEVLYSDVDYLDQGRSFTVDPVKYPLEELQPFIASLRASGRKWVPVIEAGVVKREGYQTYDSGAAADIFIKDAGGQRPFIGQGLGGPQVWPDFLHPNTSAWWARQLAGLHQRVPFDGVWLDRNDGGHLCGSAAGSQVCSGDAAFWALGLQHRSSGSSGSSGGGGNSFDGNTTCQLRCSDEVPAGLQGASSTELYRRLVNPPYAVNHLGSRQPLSVGTLPVTAVQWGAVKVYDSHSLYGLTQAQATASALTALNNGTARPYILSRATFPGSGRYAAHWAGRNEASWESLRRAVQSMLFSNIWGLPLSGADICGYSGSVTRELCVRWASAGAFYPLCRNGQGRSSPQHEFYRWSVLVAAAKKAFSLRYRLLPYLYTQLYVVHALGGMMARPLFFPFPADREARLASDAQWLLGECVLVSPAMHQGATEVSAYFPAGRWYSLWDHSVIDGPVSVQLPAPLGDVAVHVRGGCVLPMQHAMLTTSETAKTPVTLLVALSSGGTAIPTLSTSAPWSTTLEALSAGYAAANLLSRRNSSSSIPKHTSWYGSVLVECEGANQRHARGLLFVDDGESVNVAESLLAVATACVTHTAATGAAKGRLRWVVVQDAAPPSAVMQRIERVVVLGLEVAGSSGSSSSSHVGGNAGALPGHPLAAVATVSLGGQALPSSAVQYNVTAGVLTVHLPERKVTEGFEMMWDLVPVF